MNATGRSETITGITGLVTSAIITITEGNTYAQEVEKGRKSGWNVEGMRNQ